MEEPINTKKAQRGFFGQSRFYFPRNFSLLGVFSIVAILAIITAFAFPPISPISRAEAALTAEQKAALEKELAQVEAEQKKAAEDLESAKAQSSSLSRDIKVLEARIKKTQLDIKAKNLKIQTLGNEITSKVNHIESLEKRIEKGKQTLSAIMRKTYEMDAYSLPEVLLSQHTIAGFFTDIDSFQSVQNGMKETFEQIRNDEEETEAEKEDLDKRRSKEMDARYSIQQDQKSIQADEKAKQQLLSISKSNEKAYSNLVAQKMARAAQIRATLFPLAGAVEIPFGDAYNYALRAEKQTGVRPAFLLAIFAQESSLDKDATFGKHVGSCYLADPTTGSGIYISSKAVVANVMKPERDVQPFMQITKALGFDPYATRVSCPLSTGGYGGAMGPAQFIPSTWISSVKDRVGTLLGISEMPNPWNPEHAFMASAMYLSDLGAKGRTFTAERTAALRYYAGGNWALPKNAFYGNQVMIKAETIQRTMIDPLSL